MTTKLEKWHIFDEKTTPVQILDERSLFVADARPQHARLIAAAPVMLEALEAIIESATDGRAIPEWLEERLVGAKAAIRLAVERQEENAQQ